MQNSSAFQYLAIDTINESTTNPRRTFDEGKLQELAESIKHHGLIQPVTVRPNSEGFELIAGARRYRAAQLAELFSIPARIVELTDAQSQEWQLVENSQRVDVHPYEEAQGFQCLLDLPGYDVATLVEKSGKSASHIYARLSLLQLIPEVADAFTQERITVSHANLIARIPQESQAAALRAVLAQGLEGRRSPPATRQVPLRLDTDQPLSLPSRCAVRPRRPHPIARQTA
jgi:ParB family chromosome partitioning protein